MNAKTNPYRAIAKRKEGGLTPEIIAELEKYEDLKCFLKLHDLIQQVKGLSSDRKGEITKLRTDFRTLGDELNQFTKVLNKTSGAQPVKSKEEAKK